MVDVGLGQKMHMLCKGHGKPVGNDFAIIAFINSIFRVAWFYSDVLFSSHIGFTGWNVLRCLDICSRKRGQTNNSKYKHYKFEIVAFPVSSFSHNLLNEGT